MSMKRKRWTMSEAVAWLRERVKAGETEEVSSDMCGDVGFEYANGMDAEVDPKTHELTSFTFTLKDVADWPEETFCLETEWGECVARARHGETLRWVTTPNFKEPLDEGLAAEYHELLHAYVEPEWYDPSDGWPPEAPSDLPWGYLEDALYALGDVTFWTDEDGWYLFVCRNEKEVRKIARRHENLRKLNVTEAIRFSKRHFSNCFDWPEDCIAKKNGEISMR